MEIKKAPQVILKSFFKSVYLSFPIRITPVFHRKQALH